MDGPTSLAPSSPAARLVHLVIEPNSPIIRRHKNPLGIFLRPAIYPMMALGLWQHNWTLFFAGLILEALNWTIVPPVDSSFRVVEQAIDQELAWLNASQSAQKRISFMLLGLFPTSFALGCWYHNLAIMGGSILFILSFFLLMRKIAETHPTQPQGPPEQPPTRPD